MEDLHKPEEKQFVSDLISVREFYEAARFRGFTLFDYDLDRVDEDMAEQIGCSTAILNELKRVCNPETLKCGLEDVDDPLKSYVPDSSLVTLRVQKQELINRETLTYRQTVMNSLKFRRHNFPVLDSLREKLPEESRVAYEPPDVVMTVFLLKPYNRPLEHHEIRLGRLLTLDSVFLIRGQTSMEDLRAKISCCSEFAAQEDFSADPDFQNRPFAKDLYSSAFFFINNCFYNDMKEREEDKPQPIDLSEPIRRWALKRGAQGMDGEAFTVAKMEECNFFDLELRLGQPYLYLHQGHCEHLMFFSDLRLMNADDVQDLEQYPILMSTKAKKRTACFACKRYTAKWVVYGNERLPYETAFFCEECFKSFNYDKNGNKIGEFVVAPFFDRSALS